MTADIEQVLQEEKDDLQDTELCQEATNFVTLRGSHDPTVLFVGEAPGKQEDIQGKPFVGRAGDLLEQWIEGLGLDEDDYAITNVVKCRPPENRTPSREECDRFGTWLEDEIEALEPDVVMPLGKTATEFLLPESRDRKFLDETCYTVFESANARVIPLPHPAYALRNGGFDLDYDDLRAKIGGANDGG